MKSYLLKLFGREEGPYEEVQIAQMFADGLIDRNTRCKPVVGGEWKSIDDYLPMLKYGTQLPPPTKVRAIPPTPPPVILSQRVSVVDFDIPFGSVLKIMFSLGQYCSVHTLTNGGRNRVTSKHLTFATSRGPYRRPIYSAIP